MLASVHAFILPRVLTVTLLVLASLPCPALAESERLEQLEEAVVEGRQPGPPLWKITRGDNALWILPLVDVYPGRMEWESARVEKLIAESQEYLHRPLAPREFVFNSANLLSFFRTLGLYKKLTSSYGNRSLADVLPPDLLSRFRALKSRYLPGNSGIERMNLSAAHGLLVQSILERENLEMLRPSSQGSPAVITRKIQKWVAANESMRSVRPPSSRPHAATSREITALEQLLEELMRSDAFQAQQIACFATLLAFFENDLQATRRRANAWAQGRTEDLLGAVRPHTEPACRNPLAGAHDSPAMQALRVRHPEFAAALLPVGEQSYEQAYKTSHENWLTAAERALGENRSTFALLPIDDMLGSEGLVARLAAKGCSVEISAE